MWHKWVFWAVNVLTIIAIGNRALEAYDASPTWMLGSLLSITTGVVVNSGIMYILWRTFKGVGRLFKRRA